MPDRIVSLEEAAEYVGVPPSTLRQLAREQRLPGARKLGRRWRVSLNALDRWMEQANSEDP